MSPLSYIALLVVLLVATSSPAASARTESKPAAPAPPQIPKAVFIDDEAFGKDPFFPSSTRRRPKMVVRAADPTPLPQGVPDFIVLKGISVIREKKLAIFNNYTVAEGEEFSLRSGNRVVKVKCLEIKERSAVISANGVSKELPLRAGVE